MSILMIFCYDKGHLYGIVDVSVLFYAEILKVNIITLEY